MSDTVHTNLHRPFSQLTPPEVWQKLRLLSDRPGLDPELRDALAWCAGLAATQSYLRHDPSCAHLLPHKPGATRCTCGLEALRAGAPTAGGLR